MASVSCVLVKQNRNTAPQILTPAFLPRGQTVVERMRSCGIVPEQDVIVNVSKKFILGTIGALVDKFTFQGVEVTFRWSIVVRMLGTAHALRIFLRDGVSLVINCPAHEYIFLDYDQAAPYKTRVFHAARQI